LVDHLLKTFAKRLRFFLVPNNYLFTEKSGLKNAPSLSLGEGFVAVSILHG
jgi:hypothetical protein